MKTKGKTTEGTNKEEKSDEYELKRVKKKEAYQKLSKEEKNIYWN